MAWSEMTIEASSVGEDGAKTWEYGESMSSPGNGTWVLCPPGCTSIVATLYADSASGSVETTTDSLASVKAGTAVGVAWPYGTVTEITQDAFFPCTAFRMVNTTGTTRISGRAS